MFKNFKHTIIIVVLTLLICSTLPFINKKSLEEPAIDPDLEDDNQDHKATLITSSTDAFLLRIALIQKASQSIDICTYNFNPNDKSTQLIISELIKAAQRGVIVNLIVDAKIGGITKDYIRLISNIDNFNLYFYNPLKLSQLASAQVSLHTKLFTVDNRWSISGGRNTSDVFYSDLPSKKSISYDLEVFVLNEKRNTPFNDSINQYFENLIHHPFTIQKYIKPIKQTQNLMEILDQQYSVFSDRYHQGVVNCFNKVEDQLIPIDSIYLLSNSLEPVKKSSVIATTLYNCALKSKGNVYLLTPYFVKNKDIETALSHLNGKRNITLLTNSLKTSPNYPAYSNYLHHRDDIFSLGINIYEYMGHLKTSIHTKAFVLGNDLVAIGSMNLDNRSLYINTESMFLIKGQALQNQLMSHIDQQISQSHKVEEASLKSKNNTHRPRHKKFLMTLSYYVFLPFKYFL